MAASAAGLAVFLGLGSTMDVSESSMPAFFFSGGYEMKPLPKRLPLMPAACSKDEQDHTPSALACT